MVWQFNSFVLLLTLSAGLSAALAFYIWRRRPAAGATAFALLMMAVAEWSLAYALRLGVVDLPTKVFWSQVRNLGVSTVPAAWLAFALQYTGREKWMTHRNVALLAIEPLVFLLLTWTNGSHGLIWSNVSLDTSGSFPVWVASHGAGFWIHAVYSYLLLLLATALLFQMLIRSPHLYRRQTAALLIGTLALLVGNVSSIFHLIPSLSLDLTPLAFIVSGLAAAWGLFRYGLLDIVPVARDTVIENMSDGVIVLDTQDRIVDLNPAAQRATALTASEAIGQPLASVLSGWPDLIRRYQDVTKAHSSEVILTEGEAQRTFDLRISPLHDQRHRLSGHLVVLREITDRKRAEEALRRAHDELDIQVQERTAELARANEALQAEITERKRAEAEREDLLAAEREQRTLAETLAEVTLALTSQTSHAAVLDEILRQAQRIVPYRTAHIMLLEDSTLHSARWRGYEAFESEEFISSLVQSLADLPLDAEVVRSQKPFVIADTHQHPLWVVVEETTWIRSYLVLPICLRECVLGLLRLDSDTPGGFSIEDAQRLGPLANAAAIALDNARLYERQRRLLDHQVAINRLALALGEFRDLDTVYHIVYDHVQALMDANAFFVSFYDSETQLIHAGYMVSNGIVLDVTDFPPIPLEEPGHGTQSRVVHSGKPFYTPDWRKAMEQTRTEYKVAKGTGTVTKGPPPPEAQKDSVNSAVFVPMQIEGQTIGVMQAQSHRLNAYTQEDIDHLSALANVAAIAIQNARLYEQVQQHAAELEDRVVERTAELREQQASTQAILDAAGEGIIVTNLDGAILYMNPAASQLTGYSLAEASLDTPRLWKSGQHSPEFYQQMWETILSGRVWRGEVVNKRKDGALYDASLTIAPIPGEDGDSIGFVGIQEDVTRLKELDRLKDEFVSNVSHELRTPLSNLKLYLSLFQRGKPEKRARYLDTLHNETARLGQLIEDLLDVSRLDQAGAAMMEPVNLEALAADVLTNHLPQAEANQIELAFDAQPNLPPARANAAQIVQVLTNLLGNALAYTPAGGHVTVSLSQGELEGDAFLLMAVADNGPGIAPEDLPHVFERFYRGEVGRESAPGTGLGLAICRKIVDLHGGRVELESQVGEGSTFRVWLPLEKVER